MNRLLLPVAGAVLVVAAACGKTTGGNTPAAPNAATARAGEDPSTVVATVNGEKITLGELDKSLGGRLRQMEQQYVEGKHQMRQAGLEGMIAEKLVKAEAAKQGISDEDLVKQQVEANYTPPSDEEMKAFYDQRMGGQPGAPPFEEMKPRIEQFMGGEKKQQALIAYLDKLKAGAQVETSLPEPQMPKVEVAATGPSKGPADAPVTIVEFSDFECPFCSRVNPTIQQILETYPNKVRVVFRDYPLPFHAAAPKAHEGARCAHEQGKFWEMHDKLFANQKALDPASLKGYAGELGLDQAKFDECLDSGRMAQAIKDDMKAGEEAGVQGTPAFFVNGTPMSGAVPFEEFKKVIDRELGVDGGVAQK